MRYPPEPSTSYLNFERIFDAAERSGADAIHPGYGFLAENHLFAAECEARGITFIGSNSESIRLLGSKTDSRRTMLKAGIPIIPGMQASGESGAQFQEEAERVGFPIQSEEE